MLCQRYILFLQPYMYKFALIQATKTYILLLYTTTTLFNYHSLLYIMILLYYKMSESCGRFLFLSHSWPVCLSATARAFCWESLIPSRMAISVAFKSWLDFFRLLCTVVRFHVLFYRRLDRMRRKKNKHNSNGFFHMELIKSHYKSVTDKNEF